MSEKRLWYPVTFFQLRSVGEEGQTGCIILNVLYCIKNVTKIKINFTRHIRSLLEQILLYGDSIPHM